MDRNLLHHTGRLQKARLRQIVTLVIYTRFKARNGWELLTFMWLCIFKKKSAQLRADSLYIDRYASALRG